MLDPQELAALAADLESFRVERKASFKSVKSDVEEAICAFANDLPGTGQPGYVLIGVTDRTGEPTGLTITDELLREITDIRDSGRNADPWPRSHHLPAGRLRTIPSDRWRRADGSHHRSQGAVRAAPRRAPAHGRVTSARIRVATTVTGTTVERRTPDYPMEAMQQLLRNAVMHRNYETSNAPVQWYWFSDRIEIRNPGGLYGRTTPATFGLPGSNDYRNPTIAGALYVLGFVQRFGLGVPLARKACRENGNPEPEFSFGPTSFGAVVRARR